MGERMSIDEFKVKAYQAYQLQWMISHGFSLEDLFGRLAEMAASLNAEVPLRSKDTQDILDFSKFVIGSFLVSGFGSGELFAGYEEFLAREFQDGAYMKALFRNMPAPEECYRKWKGIVAYESLKDFFRRRKP